MSRAVCLGGMFTVVFVLAGQVWGQPDSPLAKYRGVQRNEAPRAKQAYRSLLAVPRVTMAAPIDDRTIVAAASRVTAISDDRLKLLPKGRYAIGENRWAVQYGLAVGDIPLAQPSSKMLLMDASGQPLESRDRQIPVSLPDSTDPTVTVDEAAALVQREAERQWSLLYPMRPVMRRWKLTKPVKEIWVDERQQGHLAWMLLVRAVDVRIPVSLQCWIAATGRARVLEVHDLIYSSHNGTVAGSVWMTTPAAGATHNTPLPGAMVTRINVGDMATTDADGKFQFPGNVAARDLILASPFGPKCVIMNDAGAELRVEDTPLGGPAAMLNFHTNEEFDLAQLSAFYWVNRAAAFTSSKIGERLNYVPTRVNLNDAGNAFWDGYALNFFRSSSDFPNTAYSDVIIHEYGHAVDGRLGGIRSRAYGEGFGDALAILITEQPVMGRDFFGMGMPMRDARQVVTWTDADVGQGAGEPHRVGETYAGFVWALIEGLRAGGDPSPFETAKKLVLDSAEMNPEDIPDAIRLTYVADDNDGNLSNGTPHAAQIKQAAQSREIPIPPELP